MSVTFVYPHLLWLLLLLPLTAGLGLLGARRPTKARFWGGLALRLALLLLIVLSLAGAQLRLRAHTLTAVFLLDESDSIPQAEQSRGEALIRQAITAMPTGDQAAVVVFGQDALVERLASQENTLPGLTSIPVTVRTDIASALQLGLALFPDEGAKRLVLLSDGRENLGQALDQADLAAAQDIQLTFIPLQGPQGEVEVLLESLDAPADVHQGQTFDLTALVQSNAALNASLRVFADGKLIHSQEVHLQPGINRYAIPVEAGEVGFRRYTAQVLPDADTRLQNNAASAFTLVHGPPSILLVQGQPEDGVNLAQALQAAGMQVTSLPPTDLPDTLPELAAYDAVILANAPAEALPAGAMQALQVYVRDLGKGLLMVGGENSFGAGGYLRTPIEETLPVYMDVHTRELSANLALVLVVDKSGSMGRCHCDNPDLNQTYTRQEVGQPKVDIAKEAVMRAASALGRQDYLGVVAFDSQASWAVDISQMADFASLESKIGSLQAYGQTNIYAGLEAAFEGLKETNARQKHIILLTDGWSRAGDFTELAQQMAQQGITLSVVAAGGGSAEYLQGMAQAGGGRYYAARDMLQVPDFFLKETVKAVGQYVIEEPFYPLPSLPGAALRGLDPAKLPALFGYNGTSPKNTARIDLATPRGDPLLATWQYGLGRAAAWTSDLKSQWAADWVAWSSYPRFSAQLVSWLLPAPQVEGLSAQASLENGQALISLEASDRAGQPLNYLEAQATVIGPDLQAQQARLTQVGAGRYQAALPLSEAGTYLIRLGVNQAAQSLGQQTLGLVVPYSPEYLAGGTDLAFLETLAKPSHSGQLADPLGAFTHNIPATDFAHEIWRQLLLCVALLFPLDVAVRRVMLGPADFRKARAWLWARLPLERIPGRQRRVREGTRALGQLFQARQRARRRFQSRREGGENRGEGIGEYGVEHSKPSPLSPIPYPPQEELGEHKEEEQQVAPGETPTDTMARLRQAKRRARREE